MHINELANELLSVWETLYNDFRDQIYMKYEIIESLDSEVCEVCNIREECISQFVLLNTTHLW